MHFVFVVGSYYPNYSAVGKCVGNVAEVLSTKHKVTVVCLKSSEEQASEENYKRQNIIRIERENNNFSDKIRKLTRFMLSPQSIDDELITLYLERLEKMKGTIDVLVPASMPFESIIASSKFKNTIDPTVKLVPYLFDKFTDSSTLHRLSMNKKIKWKRHVQTEKNVLDSADYILAMHPLEKFYKVHLPEIDKISYLEHPLIIPNVTSEYTRNSVINLSYVGGFYKGYVEPDYLLKLFTKTSLNAVLNFYVIGNCNKKIEKYAFKNKGKIINHGSVSKSIADEKLVESDILVSVAEKNGAQISSKIFEYISLGKPIVHFYTADDDVNCKILSKYPIALLLKEDLNDLCTNTQKFNDFCKQSFNKKVPAEDIVEIYEEALPEKTAEIMERVGEKVSYYSERT